MKKKFLIWILAAGCAFSVTGCGNNGAAQPIAQSAEQEEPAPESSSSNPQTSSDSEQNLENNPEYIALMEKISRSKAGVPDENGNYTIGTYGSLHSASITLLPDQAFDISATNYLITKNPDAEDTDYTQVQYSFAEDVSKEEIESSATDDTQYQEERYSDVEISSVQTMDVNGMSVSWVKHSYTYSYFTQYTQYYAWTEADEHTIFLVRIEICGDAGLDAGDNLLTQAFQGVSIK